MKYTVHFICLFLFSLGTYAQETKQTLDIEQVLQIVRQFHPVVRQTVISIEKSQSDILLARSSFDPLLSTYAAKKTFDGVNYYNYVSPEISIPTWYGIEISSGLENVSGDRLDPSQTIGKTSFVGITIPLAKNLVIDKRRAFLQQAKIFNTMAQTEQRLLINDLLMEVIDAYWTWVKTYQTFLVISKNIEVNEKRVVLVNQSYVNGERPAIDTVEAISQLQSFQIQQNTAWLSFQNAGLALSAFLWNTNNEPYLLPNTVIPVDTWDNDNFINKFSIVLIDLLNAADLNHPNLQLYNAKLNMLEIDRKLKFQEILPKLDFTYNQLGKGYNLAETIATGPLFENNFQYGVKFAVPILFRKGRGEYRNAKLKIEETKLDLSQKRIQIQVKIKSYYNEFLNNKKQIVLQTNQYGNYQQLVRAEETRFFNGESSLFMINSRENKSLESLEKLIELKTKYYKSIYSLQWSAGLLQ